MAALAEEATVERRRLADVKSAGLQTADDLGHDDSGISPPGVSSAWRATNAVHGRVYRGGLRRWSVTMRPAVMNLWVMTRVQGSVSLGGVRTSLPE